MPKGYHVLLGQNLKGIRETFEVPIYDSHFAVCVSTSIESMILEWELSLRVLVSSRSNLVAFGKYAWVGDYWWEGILWNMPNGYHVLLGWNLKGIRETFGVLIHDRQVAICVSTPIESMIPEQELSPRVLLIFKKQVKMQLKLHPTHPTWHLQMIWLECENAIEIAPQTSVLLGWNFLRIREIFGVPIYDRQLAVCVSTPIESLILEQEISLRVLVSFRSNLVAFSE